MNVEKQIEEMAYNILEDYASSYSQVDKDTLARYLYTKFHELCTDYSKPSEGEWKPILNAASGMSFHNCGAKMKGGAE